MSEDVLEPGSEGAGATPPEATPETGGDAAPLNEGENTPEPVEVEPLTLPDTVNDGVSSRQGYAVSLDMFEGPLDLLLHLVRRHELEILDIPIAFITEKYIEYLDLVRALDLEIAGEYLVMAATLAFLKSRELLPPEPEAEAGEDQGEEGVDPREELIRRLIEYERFKMVGAELDTRPVLGRDVFMRGRDTDIAAIDPGLAPISLFRLAQAYQRILDRAKIIPSHEVEIEPVTVRQRMGQLAELLSNQDSFDFIDIFLTRSWSSERELRAMLVVTLMSILEMTKLGVIGVRQIGVLDAPPEPMDMGLDSEPDELDAAGGFDEQGETQESLLVERTVAIEDMNRIIGEFVEAGKNNRIEGDDSESESSEEQADAPESDAEEAKPVSDMLSELVDIREQAEMVDEANVEGEHDTLREDADDDN